MRHKRVSSIPGSGRSPEGGPRHLFLISFASVKSFLAVSVLYCAHLWIKCTFDISSFLKRSQVFPCLFSPLFLYIVRWKRPSCIPLLFSGSLHLVLVYLSLSPLLFVALLSSAICKASSDNHFTFSHFFFFGMILFIASCTLLQTSVHSSLGTLFTRSNPLNLLSPPLYIHGIWFKLYLTSLMNFPAFFSLSLNCAIRSWWSKPQSTSGLVFADCIQLLHLPLQRIQSIWFQYWSFDDVHV